MGFYGNINAQQSPFSFDKIYPNKTEMDKNVSKDGILIGRFVLVNYDYDSNENFKIDNTSNSLTFSGWDKTIWQKTYSSNTPKYILIAKLNPEVPNLTFIEEPHEKFIQTEVTNYKANTYYYYDNNANIYKLDTSSNITSGRVYYKKEILNTTYQKIEKTAAADYKYYVPRPWDLKVKNSLKQAESFEIPNYTDNSEYGNIFLNTAGLSKNISSGDKTLSNNFSEGIYLTDNCTGNSDIKEISILLPSLGNSVSNIYDLLYGGKNTTGEISRHLSTSWLYSADANKYKDLVELQNQLRGIGNDKFDPIPLKTLAGTINTMHDLMGMIIQKRPSGDIKNLSDYIIYYENGKFYRKVARKIPKTDLASSAFQYIQVTLSGEADFIPNYFYEEKNGNYQPILTYDKDKNYYIKVFTTSGLNNFYKAAEKSGLYSPNNFYYQIDTKNYKLSTEDYSSVGRTYYKISNIVEKKGSDFLLENFKLNQYHYLKSSNYLSIKAETDLSQLDSNPYQIRAVREGLKNSKVYEKGRYYTLNTEGKYALCQDANLDSSKRYFELVEYEQAPEGGIFDAEGKELNPPRYLKEVLLTPGSNGKVFTKIYYCDSKNEKAFSVSSVKLSSGINLTTSSNDNKVLYLAPINKEYNSILDLDRIYNHKKPSSDNPKEELTSDECAIKEILFKMESNQDSITYTQQSKNLNNTQYYRLSLFNDAVAIEESVQSKNLSAWAKCVYGSCDYISHDANSVTSSTTPFFYVAATEIKNKVYIKGKYYIDGNNPTVKQTTPMSLTLSLADKNDDYIYYSFDTPVKQSFLNKEKEYYIKDASNNYIEIKDLTKTDTTYYEKDFPYIKEDTRNIFNLGQEYPLINIPLYKEYLSSFTKTTNPLPDNEKLIIGEKIGIPASISLQKLGDSYELIEIPSFAHELNTLYGLILQFNKIINKEDEVTRDLQSIQGALNKIKDLFVKFGVNLIPNTILVVDVYGNIASGEIDSKYLELKNVYDKTAGINKIQISLSKQIRDKLDKLN